MFSCYIEIFSRKMNMKYIFILDIIPFSLHQLFKSVGSFRRRQISFGFRIDMRILRSSAIISDVENTNEFFRSLINLLNKSDSWSDDAFERFVFVFYEINLPFCEEWRRPLKQWFATLYFDSLCSSKGIGI